MGYFDGLTANLFRETTDGRRAFAPFGKLGRVYLVPDEAAPRITRAYRLYSQLMLVAIIGTQTLFGWRWNVMVVAPLLFIVSLILARTITRNLDIVQPSSGALKAVSRADALRRQGQALGSGATISLLVVGLLFTAGGIAMIVAGQLNGWFVAGFFGLCTVSFVFQLKGARKLRDDQ